MKTNIIVLFYLASLGWIAGAQPLGTAFNYTGQLLVSGAPATGLYDFQFNLFTTAGPGGPTAGTPNPNRLVAVPVTNGLFTVALDFGGGAGVFSGDARWLEIGVRANETPAAPFTTLAPREQLTPTPYAIYAVEAAKAGSVSWNSIAGVPADFADGIDNDTTYSAGPGLTLSPDRTFALGVVPLDRISTTGATAGSSLIFNAGVLQWAAPSLTLSLPYSGTAVSGASSLFVGNDDVGPLAAGSGITGSHASSGTGIRGLSVSGIGVRGSHTSATGKSAGVWGSTLSEEDGASGVLGTVFSSLAGNSSAGVLGVNQSTTGKGAGVRGTHAGAGVGVQGNSLDGQGVYGISDNGTGVGGRGSARGMDGYSASGYGVAGSTFDGTGIYGDNGNSATLGHAGYFNGRVRVTQNLQADKGVQATSTAGLGVAGYTTSGTGVYGDNGNSDSVGHAGYFNGRVTITQGATVKVLTITGGLDLAEPFEMSSPAVPKGAVVVIDQENPGRLKLSEHAYDSRVAGIVSGANGVNPGLTLSQREALGDGQNVALTGRVYVQADASSAPIHPGDLLTTSEVPGHAMKVIDHAKAQGAILGKAMSALAGGRGYILVLVSLQ